MIDRMHKRGMRSHSGPAAATVCWSSCHYDGSDQAIRRLNRQGSPP